MFDSRCGARVASAAQNSILISRRNRAAHSTNALYLLVTVPEERRKRRDLARGALIECSIGRQDGKGYDRRRLSVRTPRRLDADICAGHPAVQNFDSRRIERDHIGAHAKREPAKRAAEAEKVRGIAGCKPQRIRQPHIA